MSRTWRSLVRNARVYNGSGIHSDHYLVKADISKKPEARRKMNEKERLLRIDVQKFKNLEVNQKYQLDLQNRYNTIFI